jgi:type VI secretion system protein
MVQERTLLERLADPRPGAPRTVAQNTDLLAASVLAHLRRMLNSWHGQTPTMPDYGIPTLSELIHTFPDSSVILSRAIRHSIEKYEPRLTRVRVAITEIDDDPMNVHFDISGDLVTADESAAIRLETRVDADGRVDVR